MRSSKLIETIKVFSEQELDKLLLFLSSPYFFSGKIDESAIQLLQYLRRFYPEYEDDRLDRAVAYREMFADTKFIKGKLEKVMSQLLKAIHAFIEQEYPLREYRDVQKMLAQARFFRERNLDKFFLRTFEKLRKDRAKIEQRAKDYFLGQYLIDKEISAYEAFYNKRQEDLNLPATLRHLDIFYILAKQEYTIWLLAQSKNQLVPGLRENLDSLEQVIPILRAHHKFDEPLIEVYSQVLLLLQDYRDDSAFPIVRELIRKYQHRLPMDQVQALQALCRNYSIRQYNLGNEKYLDEAFSLYREHLEEGYLHYDGGLLPSTVKNIVNVGLKFKAYDWVFEVLESYRDKIVGTKHPTDVYHFNLASYYFARETYDQALEYLSGTYEDWYYKIAARRLEIKIYYETKSVLLDPKLDAFKIFIFRIAKSQLPPLQKQANNNFADLTRQISASKTNHNRDRATKLMDKVKARKVVAEREWLIEKLTQVK